MEEQGRWSQLLSFLDEWNRPIREGDGVPLADIEAAERRLGFRLPNALREWTLLSGRRSSDEVSNTNFLSLPEQLEVNEGALIFYIENQGVVYWGIREADLTLDDPPVYIAGDLNILPHSGWIKENDSLSEFIFRMEVMDTLICAEFTADGHIEKQDAGIRDKVRGQFSSFGFPGWHWPVYPTEQYYGPDALIELYDDSSIMVGGRSETAVVQVMKSLADVDWSEITYKPSLEWSDIKYDPD